MRLRLTYLALPVLLATGASCSRLRPKPVMQVKYIQSPLQVDGRLTETSWSQAEPVKLGAYNPAVQTRHFPSTEVRAGWSETHLYLAMKAADAQTVATLTRRDDPLYNEDVLEIMVAPHRSLKRYYEFSVNSLGTQYDAFVYSPRLRRQDMQVQLEWNADGWNTAVQTGPAAWTVEMAIPFSAFPGVAPPRAGDRWRINFYRVETKPDLLFGAWSPTLTPAPDFHVPRRFGVLEFQP